MSDPTPATEAGRRLVAGLMSSKTMLGPWDVVQSILAIEDEAAALAASREERAAGTCWFCKGEFVVDALIAGYDTFDEQRLACLACNERMQGNWRPASREERPGLAAALREMTLAYHTFNGRCTTDLPSCKSALCVGALAALSGTPEAET